MCVGMARFSACHTEPGVNDNSSAGTGALRRRADAIAQAGDADHLGAMLAAEECAVLFQPVADDADAAVLARRRQRVDRAFETVEGVGGAVHAHLERLVVIVAACNRFAVVRHCASL
jgi:hypothetical protein